MRGVSLRKGLVGCVIVVSAVMSLVQFGRLGDDGKRPNVVARLRLTVDGSVSRIYVVSDDPAVDGDQTVLESSSWPFGEWRVVATGARLLDSRAGFVPGQGGVRAFRGRVSVDGFTHLTNVVIGANGDTRVREDEFDNETFVRVGSSKSLSCWIDARTGRAVVSVPLLGAYSSLQYRSGDSANWLGFGAGWGGAAGTLVLNCQPDRICKPKI